jgi:hypothetical protein
MGDNDDDIGIGIDNDDIGVDSDDGGGSDGKSCCLLVAEFFADAVPSAPQRVYPLHALAEAISLHGAALIWDSVGLS